MKWNFKKTYKHLANECHQLPFKAWSTIINYKRPVNYHSLAVIISIIDRKHEVNYPSLAIKISIIDRKL